MSDDIASRLREWASTICTIRGDETPGSKSRMAREAADEIERLRDELSARNAYESCKTLTELRHRIETLTAERDSARQRVCWSEANPEWYAEEMGWDCFKEDGK